MNQRWALKESGIDNNSIIDSALDLKEQNKLVKDFEQEIGISVDTTYNVILEVQTNTEIDGEQVANKYTSSLSIDVGKKTTTIKGENNKEDTEYISKEKNKAIDDLADDEGLDVEAIRKFFKEYDYLQREKPEIIQDAILQKRVGLKERKSIFTRVMSKLRAIIDTFSWE